MKKITPYSFMSSLSFDKRLAPFDVQGSIAHASMLAKTGIIAKEDSVKIINGLKAILKDINKGNSKFFPQCFTLPDEEDIHMSIEKELIKRIGIVGGKLHTARSRNDQVALDMRLFVKDCILRHTKLIADMQKALVVLVKKNNDVVMPGMTHLQHAQPVLLAHQLLAYAWMFQRDKQRFFDCLNRMDQSPLGSAAFAGTSFPIDRHYTATMLGFTKPTENSIDSVSDRDFIVEYISASALLMAHISRLAEDLIIWSSHEYGFVALGDSFTSGSSIMPQKKNPDFAEIIRGKTGRVYGSLMGMLTLLKGLPLTYNRDLQEDKPLLFDTVDTLDGVLALTGELIPTLMFNKKKMAESCTQGFLEATELADYLVRKGMPFRKAHGIIKKIVAGCIKKNKSLAGLSLADLKKNSKLFCEDSLELLHPKTIVETKKSYGGTSSASVRTQINKLQKLI